MVYMEQRHLKQLSHWYLCMDMRKFTSVILNINIICIPQWVFEANFDIFHCSGARARRQKHCKRECSFMQTRVDNFLPRKYDVISRLRHSYVKYPLCVTRLILWMSMYLSIVGAVCFRSISMMNCDVKQQASKQTCYLQSYEWEKLYICIKNWKLLHFFVRCMNLKTIIYLFIHLFIYLIFIHLIIYLFIFHSFYLFCITNRRGLLYKVSVTSYR